MCEFSCSWEQALGTPADRLWRVCFLEGFSKLDNVRELLSDICFLYEMLREHGF